MNNKKLTILLFAVIILIMTGCGEKAPAQPLQDPVTVLLNNGFSQTPTTMCTTPCEKYELGYGSHYTALVFTNGMFDLFVSYDTRIIHEPPLDTMEKILGEAFPSKLVNKIMSAVKALKDRSGTVDDYDWEVLISTAYPEKSIAINIRPVSDTTTP